MWVREVELKDIRCFGHAKAKFSRGINILVGPNNAGKSTVIKALLSLQYKPEGIVPEDVRAGQARGEFVIRLADSKGAKGYGALPPGAEIQWAWDVNGTVLTMHGDRGQREPFKPLSSTRPQNFIEPILSDRKNANFIEEVKPEDLNRVTSGFGNLYLEIDHLGSASREQQDRFFGVCRRTLGFEVRAQYGGRGKRAVYTTRAGHEILLTQTGEGVKNALGILTRITGSHNKLFLIEEPENDVHPYALKQVLAWIEAHADTNQFIISTHSNIVLKHLGSMPGASILRFSVEYPDDAPTSTIELVGDSHEARREALQDLGYDLFDFDLWEG